MRAMARVFHAFAALWLLLALPIAQEQALLHALAHAAIQPADEPAPSPEQCPDHALFVPFAAAVGSTSSAAPSIEACATVIASDPAASVLQGPPSPYLSRAPPASPHIA